MTRPPRAILSRVLARALARALATAALLLNAACGVGPVPIALNEDGCARCRMTISDPRFGGEAITRTGRVLKFDSVECLAAWARAAKPAEVRALYVIDLDRPGTFVPAELAGFLQGGRLQSPMGRAWVAFASVKAAGGRRAALGGNVRSWTDVLADSTAAERPAR